MIIKLVLLSILFGISTGIVFEQVDGLVEFKKYKAINSPKVCGDELCLETDEKRSKQGLSAPSIEICDDKICNEVTTKMASPIKQYKTGLSLNAIQCPDSLELVLKQLDRKPACVTPETAVKLIQRGWALPKDEQAKVISSFPAITNEQNVANGAMLSITPEIISGKNYLVFDGLGWHRLHNVEITIASDDDGKKITSVRTKTSDNGVLYMPWMLPGDLPSGSYQIHATDGIHQYELTVPISGDPAIKTKPASSELEVTVDGEKQVRRGTIHSIEVQVYRENNPINDARVSLTIEDYGEDVIREFNGYTDQTGYFVFSWEIPKSFDDIETLLAFVDVTDGISSKTKLFKFQVYCLPGEKNCQADGN
ncbi:MAG: MSCRAMM family protein [Nitrosopumilus sp.]|uniref:MSCRAMM family protein n=1 Tax=Nitrosopumilus sp. TaxID=2024843 RepID=UPI00292FB50F|nr:hypothetical protein [Nitrosopumilus sp.]